MPEGGRGAVKRMAQVATGRLARLVPGVGAVLPLRLVVVIVVIVRRGERELDVVDLGGDTAGLGADALQRQGERGVADAVLGNALGELVGARP